MKILIPVEIYQKLKGYVNATGFEISGLGKISVQENNDILIEEIKIFEQEVTYGSTELNKKDLANFYDELLKNSESPMNWKLWWHSHAKMETFWSSTDTQTIEDFDTEMESDNWVLSLETNCQNEIITRIDVFKPVRITITDIPWEITFDNREIEDNAFDEAIEKIKTPINHHLEPRKTFAGLPILTKKKNKAQEELDRIEKELNEKGDLIYG